MFNESTWLPKSCDQEDSLHCSHNSPIRADWYLLYTLFQYYFNYMYYYTHYFESRNSDLGAYSLQKTGQQAHPQLGISEQTKPRAGRTQISINNQLSLAQSDSSRSRSIWIGFTPSLRMYAIHPARTAGLKLSPNSSTVWAMAARLSCQMWSAIPSSIRTWKGYNQYNTYNRYN